MMADPPMFEEVMSRHSRCRRLRAAKTGRSNSRRPEQPSQRATRRYSTRSCYAEGSRTFNGLFCAQPFGRGLGGLAARCRVGCRIVSGALGQTGYQGGLAE